MTPAEQQKHKTERKREEEEEEEEEEEKKKKKLQSAVSYTELMLAPVVSLSELLLALLSTLLIYVSDSFKDLIHVLTTTAAFIQLHSVHTQFSVDLSPRHSASKHQKIVKYRFTVTEI